MGSNNYKFNNKNKIHSSEEKFQIDYDAIDSLKKEINSEERIKKQKPKVDFYESTFDEPISFLTWFILIVVFSILPILGIYGTVISLFIICLIAFYADAKRNLKNCARAMLMINLIILAIQLISGGIIL